jgi:hypothetical protein
MGVSRAEGFSTEAQEKAYLEAQKLIFDTFKHLTTISTGAVLLLLAFLERLFKNPEWQALVAVAFTGFILTTIASIILMVMIATDIRSYGTEFSNKQEAVMMISLVLTILSFSVGIASLVVFALKNFY